VQPLAALAARTQARHAITFSRRNFSDESHSDFAPQRKAVDVDNALDILKEDVTTNDVFVFMKGYPDAPQCGFSNQVCRILDRVGCKYASRNVLENNAVRQGVKTFSDWPTIPQLYVKGEFVGGCDIITEMFKEGELEQLMKDNGIELKPEE